MKNSIFKFRFLIVTLCILFVPASSKAQFNKDSITNMVTQIRGTTLDTAQVVKLCELGYRLIEQDSALSHQLLDEAISKSLVLKEKNTIAYCYRMMGIWYSAFNERDKALQCYQASLNAARGNDNLYQMAGACFNIGNIKYWKGEYDSCIFYYQQAQIHFENPKLIVQSKVAEPVLDRKKAELYGNISTVFNTIRNIKKADEYIDKAIAITQKYKSPAAQQGLAFFMQQKADNFKDNGQEETALRLRLQYLPVLEKAGLKASSATAYQNIANAYINLDKIDSAGIFAQKCLAVATELEQVEAIAGANFVLTRIALKSKDYSSAGTYASKAKEFYENTEDPHAKSTWYGLMRDLSYAQGKYKEAYDYFAQYNIINDSLHKGEQAIAFSEKEMRYETDKKEALIKLQEATIKQKNTLNYIFIGGTVVLLTVGLLVYRNYRQRQTIHQQRITELETEKLLTATEAVLKGEEQERTRLAKDLHDGLGGLLSGVKLQLGVMKGNLILSEEHGRIFNNALTKLDESISEMRRVAHNMMPEALLNLGLEQALRDYCSGLSQSQPFVIHCEFHGLENRLHSSQEIVVYRIVQELLNNAVKHAGATKILAQVIRRDELLDITIEDDGKGFDAAGADFVKGTGLASISSRVNYLKGQMNISSAPGKGTTIHIECKTDDNG